MKDVFTPNQAQIFAELSRGMNPVQSRRLLSMLQQTDERFRPVRNMLPIANPPTHVTAGDQMDAYRKRLTNLVGMSDRAQASIDLHVQDVEAIKFEQTKATGTPRAAVSFRWARGLALFRKHGK